MMLITGDLSGSQLQKKIKKKTKNCQKSVLQFQRFENTPLLNLIRSDIYVPLKLTFFSNNYIFPYKNFLDKKEKKNS